MDHAATRAPATADTSWRDRVLSRPVLLAAPVAIIVVYAALLTFEPTRHLAQVGVTENRPVEQATVVLCVVAAVLGVRHALRLRRRGEPLWAWGFWLVFSGGLFVIGMEEIAWGQSWFGFSTPEALREINEQDETTLHNISIFQDYLETFPLLYGIGGLVGIGLSRRTSLRLITPPAILWTWFATVVVVSGLDLVHEFVIPSALLDRVVNDLDEVVELLVAASATLFIYLEWLHPLHESRAHAESTVRP